MTLFPVPEEFFSEPKYLGWSAEAYSLWIIAGSWSCYRLTDGLIPTTALALFPPAFTASAEELVSRGIWRRARGGFQYAEWPRQCTRAYVEAKRESERKKKARQRGTPEASQTESRQATPRTVPPGHNGDSPGNPARRPEGSHRPIS